MGMPHFIIHCLSLRWPSPSPSTTHQNIVLLLWGNKQMQTASFEHWSLITAEWQPQRKTIQLCSNFFFVWLTETAMDPDYIEYAKQRHIHYINKYIHKPAYPVVLGRANLIKVSLKPYIYLLYFAAKNAFKRGVFADILLLRLSCTHNFSSLTAHFIRWAMLSSATFHPLPCFAIYLYCYYHHFSTLDGGCDFFSSHTRFACGLYHSPFFSRAKSRSWM